MTWIELIVQFVFWLLCCLLAAWIVVSVKHWAHARRERQVRMSKVAWMLPYLTSWANPREHYIDTPNYMEEDK